MPRVRREIYSGQTYEVCMRTRAGLPFACTKYMKMLLEGILARVQRDNKVTLCHFIWMANHAHMIIVAKDKDECTKFYGELQKQLTEAVKKLLGLKYLNLWNNNATSVIPLHDLETACYRIGYLYANPVSANLVESIDDYPGVSSWGEFIADKKDLNARHVKNCHWIRQPMIKPLNDYAVSREEDLAICEEWNKSAKKSHELAIEPNAWIKTFNIEKEEDVEGANKSVMQFYIGLEQTAKEAREKEKKKVMGKKRLKAAPINMAYAPKKTSGRIFVICLDPKLRAYLIQKYKEFCELCRMCYERWKVGDFTVKWPPGAFLPPKPTTINYLKPEISNVY
jgi:REP element-mobilizing transposase RayT